MPVEGLLHSNNFFWTNVAPPKSGDARLTLTPSLLLEKKGFFFFRRNFEKMSKKTKQILKKFEETFVVILENFLAKGAGGNFDTQKSFVLTIVVPSLCPQYRTQFVESLFGLSVDIKSLRIRLGCLTKQRRRRGNFISARLWDSVPAVPTCMRTCFTSCIPF